MVWCLMSTEISTTMVDWALESITHLSAQLNSIMRVQSLLPVDNTNNFVYNEKVKSWLSHFCCCTSKLFCFFSVLLRSMKSRGLKSMHHPRKQTVGSINNAVERWHWTGRTVCFPPPAYTCSILIIQGHCLSTWEPFCSVTFRGHCKLCGEP